MFSNISGFFYVEKFAGIKNNLYLCAVMNPRLGIMSLRVGNYRHNKGVKTGSPINFVNLRGVQRALCLAIRNLANFN